MSAEREKFGAWARSENYDMRPSEIEGWDYGHIGTQRCWESWQARAEARPSVSGLPEVERVDPGKYGRHKYVREEHYDALLIKFDAQSSRIVELEKELAEAKSELSWVDNALARRPAVADAVNRYSAICMAFDSASRNEEKANTAKHWEGHYERQKSRAELAESKLAVCREETIKEDIKLCMEQKWPCDNSAEWQAYENGVSSCVTELLSNLPSVATEETKIP